MTHIKTKTGFEADINESALDDMELFEALVDMQAGDATQIPTVVRKICGPVKAALYNHVRLEDGRVPTEAVTAELEDIIDALKAKKS